MKIDTTKIMTQTLLLFNPLTGLEMKACEQDYPGVGVRAAGLERERVNVEL